MTVIVYYKKLKTVQASLQQTLVIQRRDLYSSWTTSLSGNEVDTMMLHVADHSDPKIYEARYARNPQRIPSYLLTAYHTDKPTRLVRLRALG